MRKDRTKIKNEWGTIILRELPPMGGREPEPDEIYRIDFEIQPYAKNIKVTKIGKDAGGKTLISYTYYEPGFEMGLALDFLEVRGWKIREYLFEFNDEPFFPGARAFRHKLYPIRRRSAIDHMRGKIELFKQSMISKGKEPFKGLNSTGRNIELMYDL